MRYVKRMSYKWPFRAHFGQRGPGGLRRVDGEESRAALPGWTRRQMKGGRKSTSREKRRRAVVSSADYGDFVVSESRRDSHRCGPDIVDFTSSFLSCLQQLQHEEFCDNQLGLREVCGWHKSGHGGNTSQVILSTPNTSQVISSTPNTLQVISSTPVTFIE